MDIFMLLHSYGGVVAFATLIANGLTRPEVRQAVDRGVVVRLRRGVYGLPNISEDLRAASCHGGMLTCVSLLRAIKVWVLPSDTRVHVWMGAKGNQHPHQNCSCIPHWSPGRSTVGAVGLETALLHLRRCSGDLAFFASFESAWALRKLSQAARSRIRDRLPASKRWLVDRAVGNAGSGLESILRFRLMHVGMVLRTQVQIDTVGRVDFVAVAAGRWLILEVDGREFHTTRHAFDEDRRRQAAASVLGIETLNFSYNQVLQDWPSVLASIRAALVRTADAA